MSTASQSASQPSSRGPGPARPADTAPGSSPGPSPDSASQQQKNNQPLPAQPQAPHLQPPECNPQPASQPAKGLHYFSAKKTVWGKNGKKTGAEKNTQTGMELLLRLLFGDRQAAPLFGRIRKTMYAKFGIKKGAAPTLKMSPSRRCDHGHSLPRHAPTAFHCPTSAESVHPP